MIIKVSHLWPTLQSSNFYCRTNCCIGQHNHVSFLGAIIAMIITGLWGVYLSFASICDVWDSTILHVDCSNVYSKSRWVKCGVAIKMSLTGNLTR